jgi:predicted MFS family arabinose efflux permease
MMGVMASSFPVGSMLSYFLGNSAYSFFGPRFPFGMLLAMGLVDAILRLVMEDATENTTNCPKKRGGTYFGYVTNGYFVLTILMTFITSFAFAAVSSTAPNWVTNVLHAKQWQYGVVLGISSTLHLVSNMVCGFTLKINSTWVFMFASCIVTTIGLIIYPLTPGVWYTLAPEILVRIAYGIMVGTASNFISILTETLFDGETAKAFSLFVASYISGFTLGPLLGGILLQYTSFMVLYYYILPVVFISGFGAFYQKTLVNHDDFTG